MSTAAIPFFPDVEIAIRCPEDFVSVLQAVRNAIAQGTLVHVKPAGAAFALDDILVLRDEGPWPDYVEAYFESAATGARYRLSAETYHGAGGSWERC